VDREMIESLLQSVCKKVGKQHCSFSKHWKNLEKLLEMP